MLNKEFFVLLAGNPDPWDDEVLRRTRQGRESLIKVQEDQYSRGRRSAKLMHLAMGWAVADTTGLESSPVLFRKATKREALNWGMEWAKADPKNREFFATKKDMEDSK
jgi:hypothetical protein